MSHILFLSILKNIHIIKMLSVCTEIKDVHFMYLILVFSVTAVLIL
jgi:hypothetical protein